MAAARGIAVCAHLMAGLPGEAEEHFLQSLDWALSLPISGLKLHNVYVPKGTELAAGMPQASIIPSGAMNMSTFSAPPCRASLRIVMHRLQSDPAPGELLAPTWATDKRGLLGGFAAGAGARELWQGKFCDSPEGCPTVFFASGCVRDDFALGRVP